MPAVGAPPPVPPAARRQPAAANLPPPTCAPRTRCSALQQLLWKLGDSSKVPAAVARAFCQQHVQHPQQLEREAL